ncbi:peptidase domain-containing ABC transporter [Thalassotalea agarivorans]|uniref:ATP-binding cassette, subfamily B, RaxB n=1 Tax=Thalassotalea agarivorans TaxID=349064 RepID=A0A1I0GAK9_THASX|nr:peptidase domain-containing ABC transporter [Thalassotalea agarivorans]SET67769.1 ATP-binding cassette, subfamily B, RaxB [Thalassotalea agarivorans]
MDGRVKLNFKLKKSVPVVLQTEVAECGLASLAMVAAFHGYSIDLPNLRKLFCAGQQGMNLQQMIEVAGKLNLASRPLQCPIDELHKLKLPCILHWDLTHFVVLTKVSSNKKHVVINDPAIGRRKRSIDELSKHYTGICLELTPTNKFKKKTAKQTMRLGQLWGKLTGFASGLSKLFALSLLIQCFALLSPYYMQWVVDEVIPSYDKNLLVVLAFGFGLLCLVNVISTVLRSWLVVRLSSTLNLHLGINVLSHLLKLPMSFFERRHIGDITSRFGSLAQIRERLTNGFVETLVDGVMAALVIVVMFFYSTTLTFIVLASVSLYVLFRLSLYPKFHRANEELIQTKAKEHTNFLENVRAIQPIKLYGHEPQRQAIWQNKYVEVVNNEIKIGRLKITFDAFNQLLFGCENVLVIYVATILVLSGQFTIGMLLAFIAYKKQLTTRLANLVEQLIEFKMMRLHLARLSDITLAKQEQYQEGTGIQKPHGQVTLKDVAYNLPNGETLFSNVNLNVEAGQAIAISGPSGSGKTTLLKIMLGLIQPSAGKVLLDGTDIKQIGLTHYRKVVAVVMQEDQLLNGSIMDNICFFDAQPNPLKVEKCAQLANVANDILAMPMGFNTLVGDMGSTLSGGQKQRILLARALYKEPKVLFLDEATSHLDQDNESSINNHIASLNMTRISVAHRTETLNSADKIYHLEHGVLSQNKLDTESQLIQRQ